MAGPVNPDATLNDLRQCAAEYVAASRLGGPDGAEMARQAAERMARGWQALDAYLAGGGPLPRDWRRVRDHLA